MVLLQELHSSVCSVSSIKACVRSSGALHVVSVASPHSHAYELSATAIRLLKHCGAEAISQIFKVEITGDLLGQVLLVLQQEWSQQAQQNQQTTTSSSSTSSSTADAENVAAEAGCTSQRQEAMFVVELLHILTGVYLLWVFCVPVLHADMVILSGVRLL